MVRLVLIGVLSGCMMAQVPAGVGQNQQNDAKTTATTAPAAPAGAAASTGEGSPFDQFPEFSAIMVGSVMIGDQSEMHVYRSKDFFRAESGEGSGYFITRLDNLDSFGLSKTGCMHDSHPYYRAFPLTAFRKDRKIERVKGEKETIDGHVSQIEDITISGGTLMNAMKLRFWEAEDLQGFPVKVEIVKGPHAVIRYKNIVIGPQDKTLFTYPNSCSKGIPQPPGKMPDYLPQGNKAKPAKPASPGPQN